MFYFFKNNTSNIQRHPLIKVVENFRSEKATEFINKWKMCNNILKENVFIN